MFEAILLNPGTRRRAGRKRKGKGARRGKKTMKKSRKRRGRRKVARRTRRTGSRKARRRTRRNPQVKSYRRKGGRVKSHWRRKLRRLRNPISIGGRKGKFDLIPSVKTIQEAAYKGGGAVASEVVRATAYSLLGRASGSVAEDVVGRLAAGAVTGMLAGYVLGSKVANAVVEGTYTVTLYQLIADAMALATRGAPKLGPIANPFTSVPTKPLLPGISLGGSAAPAGVSGLRGVVPERNVLPLGGVVPEGDITPLGADEVPARLRSRF